MFSKQAGESGYLYIDFATMTSSSAASDLLHCYLPNKPNVSCEMLLQNNLHTSLTHLQPYAKTTEDNAAGRHL